MALSFSSVQKAYGVFHTLKEELLPELKIFSYPQDMGEWKTKKQVNPPTNEVFGWDKKFDNGWESISFFVKNPSKELIARFDELKDNVPNTSLNGPYHRNEKLWVIGWF